MPSTRLRTMGFATFHAVVGLILLYWLVHLKSGDVESARRTVQSLITLAATLLGFLLAILAFSMTMTFSQVQRLEPFRISLLSDLQEKGDIGVKLQELAQRYREVQDGRGGLPAGFKYHRVRHVGDKELIAGLDALGRLARKQERGGEISLARPLVRLDTISFFRFACTVLLSDACVAREASDPLAKLSRKLGVMESHHNIVSVVNNAHDIRRAARRSLPLFMFFLILSWLASTVYLSGLSPVNFNHTSYAVVVAPTFLIAYGFGYYSYQILSRYFQ